MVQVSAEEEELEAVGPGQLVAGGVRGARHDPKLVRSLTIFKEYLRLFSGALTGHFADARQWVRRIMSDLQPLFRDFGVEYENIEKIPQHFHDDVHKAYAYSMHALGRDKFGLLIEHDVEVISHLRRCVSETGESRLCLTWDAVMIGVGRDLPVQDGW